MKKNIAILLILAFFAACNNGKKADEKTTTIAEKTDTLTYRFDSIKVVSKNIVAANQSPFDTPKAVIRYPVFENNTLNDFMKRKVFDFFDDKEKATSLQDIANSFINGYDSFAAENKDRPQAWQLLVNLSVIAQHHNYVAIKYLHYDFVGGAHGNTNISFLNFNPVTNQEILLDSLILPAQKTKLTQVAEQIFRKNEKLSPTASLENYFFTDAKFSLPNRFYISNEGLVFLYVPYEIKPYAAGTTTLMIPFQSLSGIARPHSILSKD